MRYGRLTIQMVTVAALTLCVVLLVGPTALAQESPCAGDVEKFCQGIKPGGGRIAKCLAEHKEELSPGCQARLEGVALQLKGVQQACQDDIITFCPGVKPGARLIARCLRKHYAELSPECKEKIAEARRELKK